MNIYVCSDRPGVQHALYAALPAVMQATELSHLVIPARSLEEISTKFSYASVIVLDTYQHAMAQLTQVTESGLRAFPNVRVAVISGYVPLQSDQRLLFHLGQVGVWQLVNPEAAVQSAWWVTALEEVCGYSAVSRWKQYWAERLAPVTARDLFCTFVLDHCAEPSVQAMAERLYRADNVSPAAKRRRLWSECKRFSLPSPTDLWVTARLTLLKALLDDRQWSLKRIATYLGHTSVRNLSATCKRQYDMTPTDIRNADAGVLYDRLESLLAKT